MQFIHLLDPDFRAKLPVLSFDDTFFQEHFPQTIITPKESVTNRNSRIAEVSKVYIEEYDEIYEEYESVNGTFLQDRVSLHCNIVETNSIVL